MKVYGECDSDGNKIRLFVVNDLKVYRKLLSAIRKKGFTVTYYDDTKMLDFNATHKYMSKLLIKVKYIENEV